MRFLRLGIPVLLALSLLFVSCAETKVVKDTVVFSWPVNVGPLNPHRTSPNQMFAQAMVYEPLVRYGVNGALEPHLARSWEVSPDGRSYTFQLRTDVRFSNGEPFNAAAVKANFDAVLKNIESHRWLELINLLEGIDVVDEYTVRLNLRESYYPALQELTLVRPVRFLAPSQMPENGNTGEGIKAPIGTGPWVLESSVLGVEDVFVRNDNYWGPKPKLKRVVVKVVPDANARALAFEAGEIDLIYGVEGQISPDAFTRFQGRSDLVTQVSKPYMTRALALNSTRSGLRDRAVRQALNHAVDRETIARSIFSGLESPAYTLFAPNVPYADLGLSPYRYDASKAALLLEEAGWTLGADGLRSRGGEKLQLALVFNGSDAIQKSLAEVMQGQLKAVGIDLVLEGLERTAYYARQKEGTFDLIFNDTWGPPYDPHTYLSGMRHPSHADYEAQKGLARKAELDAWITDALRSTDVSQRQELYRNILTLLHDEAVYLPLTTMNAIAVSRPWLGSYSMGLTVYDFPFGEMGSQNN